MNRKISIVLVGIGGYGQGYVDALLGDYNEDRYYIAGVIDPFPEKCERIKAIKEKDIQVYSSMEDFYACSKADLAIISSPLHYHSAQICYALGKGSNVLCEKPICSTVQDAMKIIQERDRTGKFVAIGYQWCYTNAIQELKRDIITGVLGKPKRLKTIVLTPRTEAYYKRAGWVGKKQDAQGNWVLDSVVGNATAHYLHNMFYLLGNRMEQSISLEGVVAELYRANEIDNYDTAAARIFTEDGVEILYYASHATEKTLGPTFHFEFEKASVRFETDWEGIPYSENKEVRKGNIWAAFNDDSYKIYGNPNEDEMNKLATSMKADLGKTTIPCGPEASMVHTICTNGMQDSMPQIQKFPEDIINRKVDEFSQKERIFAKGLDDILTQCYDKGILPSESGIQWAKKGRNVDLRNYTCFVQ